MDKDTGNNVCMSPADENLHVHIPLYVKVHI